MNQAFKKETVETITLSGLARQHLAKAKGDGHKASAAMIAHIMRNPDVLAAIVEDAITAASKAYVNTQIMNSRAQIVRVANGQEPYSAGGMTAAAASAFSNSMRHCLLDFPLTNGLKLRDARSDDLEVSADRYEKNSRTEASRARWLRSIQSSLPEGKKVGSVFGEDELKKLFEESGNA